MMSWHHGCDTSALTFLITFPTSTSYPFYKSPPLFPPPGSRFSASPPSGIMLPPPAPLAPSQQVLLQKYKTGQVTMAATAATAAAATADITLLLSTAEPRLSNPASPLLPPTDPRLLCNAAGHMPLHYATIRRDLALILHPAFRCGNMCDHVCGALTAAVYNLLHSQLG